MQDLEETSKRLYAEKKFKEVEDMFTTFIKESQDQTPEIQARALNNRGHAKYMKVEFDDALADYNAALKLYPDLTVTHYNRGTILHRLGSHKEALNDLQVAVDKDPLNPEFKEALDACKKQLQ